jgi:hypothetical protein
VLSEIFNSQKVKLKMKHAKIKCSLRFSKAMFKNLNVLKSKCF